MAACEKSSYPGELRQKPAPPVSRLEGGGRGLVLCGAGCGGRTPDFVPLRPTLQQLPKGARHKDTNGPGHAAAQGRGANSFLTSDTHGITLPFPGKRPSARCNVLPKPSTR